jgi:hypothetical protein
MNTTEPHSPPPPAGATTPWTDAARAAPLSSTELPAFGEMLDDILPVIGVVLVAGPPVIFVAGPWLLLALMLSGPFALLVAFVVVGLVAAALVVTLAAIVATPYVLVRRLHGRYRASRAIGVPATPVASLHSPGVAA